MGLEFEFLEPVTHIIGELVVIWAVLLPQPGPDATPSKTLPSAGNHLLETGLGVNDG